MKTKLPLFVSLMLLLNFSYLHSQTVYTFDQVVKSTFSTRSMPNQKQTHFFNSKDQSFFMRVFKKGDSLIAKLCDVDQKKAHFFYALDHDQQKFQFLETKSYEIDPMNKVFEFSELGTKTPAEELFVTVRDPEKTEKAYYNLKVREVNNDLFHVFKFSVLDDLGISPLWSGQNFLVVEAIGENSNGICQQYKLDSIQNVQLALNIPVGK